eukprot:scaffold1518_cov417-Prasinococcus_capsulatus_cf.AAC.27
MQGCRYRQAALQSGAVHVWVPVLSVASHLRIYVRIMSVSHTCACKWRMSAVQEMGVSPW